MRRRWWIGIAALCILAGGLAIGVPLFMPPKPGVNYKNFSRIEKGMTQQQVEQLLGKAKVKRQQDWYWVSELNDVAVEFDADGRVVQLSWNGWPEERTWLQKLRDRIPWLARTPPGRFDLRDVT